MAAVCVALGLGCETVDLGDNFVTPDVALDEDFFHCRIQPEIIAAHTCASGSGECHSSRSVMRLDPAGEADAPPTCEGDMVTGTVPPSYQNNFAAVRPFVRMDALSSPFYLRPTQLESHPELEFTTDSPEALLIVEWINRGGGR